MNPKHVIIVEDDEEICDLIKIHLIDLNCTVSQFNDGATGLKAILEESCDLVVLDLMLPQIDGVEVCRQVRAAGSQVPIIMLTAKSEEIDRVLGLELGADDYITKPFSMREFIARVKGIFRRSEQKVPAPDRVSNLLSLDNGSLTINIEMRKVTLNGQRIELSPKEFELLVLLASNPGKNYKRSQLLNLIWGYDFDGYSHTVNSHINRLRTKIEPSTGNPRYIMTSWGVGYKFNEEL
ncbi:MAG: response regulator transcription factor [Leeuwenhoekiella sp.]